MQFPVAVAMSLLALATPFVQAVTTGRSGMIRTVVTTDMEQDDLASLIRYLLYTNELDTQGLIYTSSRFHWAGDGNGTKFFMPDREYDTAQWTWRWTGTRFIQDKVLKAYAEVYPNLHCHDPFYPTPEELLSIVKVGNIDFEGEMSHDTEGSNLIRSLLLDEDPRPLYLQAWGGINTIARALKSIEETHSSLENWSEVQKHLSKKAVILASGFQDKAYDDYVAVKWPQVRVENLEAGYKTWGYNCEKGQGNTRGLPGQNEYFTGAWMKENIQTGPYGKLYRSWLDGQSMPGDQNDIFGDPAKANSSKAFCKPLEHYSFLSEGDNVAFNPLVTTGIQDPTNPSLGGWGGRSIRNSTSQDLWTLADSEMSKNGSDVDNYTTDRWMAAAQNDFAARMKWTLTADYAEGNHAPSVKILNETVQANAGSTVALAAAVSDPDSDNVTTSWWQFFEEGTYPGSVTVTGEGNHRATVKIPEDAKPGQTLSIILEGTDDGHVPLTRYGRIYIQVV
ncbi:unnamed protein product [Penicillium olsonii]|nr:unnamed protein product [Penicillium olsonii]CAG7928577.1 unnamed protein product [Penicillium olsonii]